MSARASAARGLDHLVVAVRDLDAAVERYAALGFTTTPKAMHPWGTGNALVQLDRSFFELLGVQRPDAIAAPGPGEFGFGDFNRRFLERREGMSMLVFSTTDAAADLARWRDTGLETYSPFDFSRSARLPDGREVTVAFSLAFVTDPLMPWAAWFVCQQHHPQHFWKAEFQRHANGARALERVVLVAPDPARHAGFLGALFPEATLKRQGAGIALALPAGTVEVVLPHEAERLVPGFDRGRVDAQGPHFVAASVRVSDRARIEALLGERGIDCVAGERGPWVRARDACGLALEFIGA